MEQMQLAAPATCTTRTHLEEPEARYGREWKRPRDLRYIWSNWQRTGELPLLVATPDGWRDARVLNLLTDRTIRGAEELILLVEVLDTGSRLPVTNRESLRIANG